MWMQIPSRLETPVDIALIDNLLEIEYTHHQYTGDQQGIKLKVLKSDKNINSDWSLSVLNAFAE